MISLDFSWLFDIVVRFGGCIFWSFIAGIFGAIFGWFLTHKKWGVIAGFVIIAIIAFIISWIIIKPLASA